MGEWRQIQRYDKVTGKKGACGTKCAVTKLKADQNSGIVSMQEAIVKYKSSYGMEQRTYQPDDFSISDFRYSSLSTKRYMVS